MSLRSVSLFYFSFGFFSIKMYVVDQIFFAWTLVPPFQLNTSICSVHLLTAIHIESSLRWILTELVRLVLRFLAAEVENYRIGRFPKFFCRETMSKRRATQWKFSICYEEQTQFLIQTISELFLLSKYLTLGERYQISDYIVYFVATNIPEDWIFSTLEFIAFI